MRPSADAEEGTSISPGHPRETAPARRGDLFDPACPTRHLLERLGSKWTSMAILALSEASPSEVRFSELRRRMAGVSQKMLSQTLRSLQRDGLVTRRVEDSVPPRVFYGLTDRGRSLQRPLAILRDWAEENMDAIDRGR